MTQTKTRALTEGALMVAAATALSYVKLLELPQGGSVCIGMLPIFLYCARWGCKESFLASFAYGLLQLIWAASSSARSSAVCAASSSTSSAA